MLVKDGPLAGLQVEESRLLAAQPPPLRPGPQLPKHKWRYYGGLHISFLPILNKLFAIFKNNVFFLSLVHHKGGDGHALHVETVGAEHEAHLLQVERVDVVVVLPVDLGNRHLDQLVREY